MKKVLSSLFLIVILNVLIKPIYILGIDAEVINRGKNILMDNILLL